MELRLNEKSIYRFGCILCFIAGGVFILITIGIALDPLGLATGYTMEQLVNKNMIIDFLWRTLFGCIGVINIGFVITASLLFRPEDGKVDGVLIWVTILGIASGIISALNWIHFVHIGELYQYLFNQGTDVSSFINEPIFPVDSFYVWTFGMLGVYMIIINRIGLITKKVPVSLNIWGIITGIFSIMVSLVYILDLKLSIGEFSLSMMIIFGGLTGGVMAPVYYFRFANQLRKMYY